MDFNVYELNNKQIVVAKRYLPEHLHGEIFTEMKLFTPKDYGDGSEPFLFGILMRDDTDFVEDIGFSDAVSIILSAH